MFSPLTWLSRRRHPYEPLISVEIARERLLHNLRQFMHRAPHGRVAPVLKSNAYGHDLLTIARILERMHNPHIPFFCVDSYFEAVALRSKGIRTHLLVIGYTRPEIIKHNRLRHVSFMVGSIDNLNHLESIERTCSIHLKIDTGMHRQGILPEQIAQAIELLVEQPLIELDGIFTHLYDADNPDSSASEAQIHAWNKITHTFRAAFPLLKHIHVSATDGHSFTSEIDATVSRLGIGLYGISECCTFSPKLNLLPVLEMKTIITGVKQLKRDDVVGYAGSFKADRDMKIATIPVGYFEGLDRRLSNNGFILVGSERVPCAIIGRVSMNITTIDVSHVRNVSEGTPVVVISAAAIDPNSIVSTASRCGTIPYEIAVHIPQHLKRKVI